MSFEVETQGLQNARVLIQISRQDLSRTLDQRLEQARYNLGYAMRDSKSVSQVIRSLDQVREDGRRLARKLDAYDEALHQVVRIYERTEDEVMSGARSTFVRAKRGNGIPSGRQRGLNAPSYQLFVGIDGKLKSLLEKLYSSMVRPL